MAHLAMCQSSPNRDFARGEKTPPDAGILTNPWEGANRRCDCDGYRPDTLGGAIGKPRLLFGVMGTHERGYWQMAYP